ncbi:MAG: type I DNA topoisomerase [Microgenomates group bacterium]
MTLIIVESPTKARTFNRILKIENKTDYFVFATLGHFRDLPSATMSIDLSHDFKPSYEIMSSKQKVVAELKRLATEHDEIILATDADREGESISYHAAYILGFINESWPDIEVKSPKGGSRPKGDGPLGQPSGRKTLKRIVFHEITAKALNEALTHDEELRLDLVKAQQARRVIDRIVGYELSPLLWKKLSKNWLSAGRVQTVALRLVVEREKEVLGFNLEKFSVLGGTFQILKDELVAKLVSKNGESFEEKKTLKLFSGEYTYTKGLISKEKAVEIENDLKEDSYKVSDVNESETVRYPPPPYTTSQLQQDAINRYGLSSKMVMRIAQDLYERGLITYHRTDSFNLSASYVFKAKDFITENYGKEYALEKPRGYKTKSSSAQEAHEAIRPTKVDRTPQLLAKDKKLNRSQLMIYELIFNRALATQMKEASLISYKVTVKGTKGYEFLTEAQKIVFDGFLRVQAPEFVKKHTEGISIKVDSPAELKNLTIEEKESKAPYRYSEASLIKALEEHGIGRPSTYAPIMSLIIEKGYVDKDGRYLKPTSLGTAISDYLSKAFGKLFNIDFTAKLEQELDDIAEGKLKMLEVLKGFYTPFNEDLKEQQKDDTKVELKEEVTEPCPTCGSPLQIRFSKFGKFYACTAYPKCKFTKSFLKLVSGKKCPKDGGDVVVRYSKAKRKFYGCSNYPKCDYVEFGWSKLVKSDENKADSNAKDKELTKKTIVLNK